MKYKEVLTEEEQEMFWDTIKKPCAVILANEEGEADIGWAQWDFDNKDAFWRIEVLNELIGLINRKLEKAKKDHKKENKK
jgi:hypothetical protein